MKESIAKKLERQAEKSGIYLQYALYPMKVLAKEVTDYEGVKGIVNSKCGTLIYVLLEDSSILVIGTRIDEIKEISFNEFVEDLTKERE